MTKFARIASLLAFLFGACLVQSPAHAQFAGFGGGGGDGDGDMMTTMAPMLEMMKKKLGKKRFTQMMQTMGPMMEKMGDGGGLGGGGGFGGLGGGGFDVGSFTGGGMGGMEQFMSSDMLGGVMKMAMSGGGHRKGRRNRRHH